MKTIIISGPTASGKSNLAHYLAENLNLDIINCDSVQLYKGFDIGSAKASSEELKRYRYSLVDVALAAQPWDVAKYIKELEGVLATVNKPIISGGSTLYIKAFLEGLIELEAPNLEYRTYLESLSIDELYELYLAIPEEQESINKNDKLRLIRSLEIYKQTGKSKSDLIANQLKPKRNALIILPIWKREELYNRINLRTSHMLAGGIIEETKNLLKEYSADLPIFKSLGYAQCCQFIKGEIEQETLQEEIAQYTRRYAKRQLTFWRNEPQKNSWDYLDLEDKYQKVDIDGFTSYKLEKLELSGIVREYLKEETSTGVKVLPLDASSIGL